MARSMETGLTISCMQCDWSVETTNTSMELSAAFLEAAQSHADLHEQHAIEIVQRLRVYSANYVEPTPPTQDVPVAARRDSGIQTGFLDRTPTPGSLKEPLARQRMEGVNDDRILHEV